MSSRREDPGPQVDPLDLTQLRDAVETAEGALRHEDEQLRHRVEDVQALDGMVLAAWTTLLGTREERLEERLAAVQHARGRVAQAKDRLEAARAELAAAESGRRESEERTAKRIAALEARADAIRGTNHPAARELARLEEELATLRSRIAALDEVMAAAGGVMGAANAGGRVRAGTAWTTQSRRLEEALAGLGISWSPKRAGGARLEPRRSDDGPSSARLKQLGELEVLREEIRQVLEPILAHRKATSDEVNAAQDARDRLLANV